MKIIDNYNNLDLFMQYVKVYKELPEAHPINPVLFLKYVKEQKVKQIFALPTTIPTKFIVRVYYDMQNTYVAYFNERGIACSYRVTDCIHNALWSLYVQACVTIKNSSTSEQKKMLKQVLLNKNTSRDFNHFTIKVLKFMIKDNRL